MIPRPPRPCLHDLGADAERIGYRWFRSGNLIESFGAGPNHEDDSKKDWGEPVRFRSEVRAVEDLDEIDPLAFVDRFLRDQRMLSSPLWQKRWKG